MRSFQQHEMPFRAAPDNWDVVGGTSVLERARRRLVARRLPMFVAASLATSATWMAVVTWMRPAAFVVCCWTLVVQILILGMTIWACRRDPAGPRVRPTVVAAAVTLGWSTTWGFRVADQPSDVLAFVLVSLFLAAALLFAWGWQAELVVLMLTLAPALPVMHSLGAAVPVPAFASAVLMGAAISLAIAEGSARAFGTAVLHRQRATARARELEISRDAYRDLAEKQRDFIYAGDLTNRVTYVNEALAAFIGHPVSAIIGRYFHEFTVPHPDSPDVDTVIASIAAGERQPPLTFVLQTAAGLRWSEER
jgi:PAS domain S-box-containing protein